MEGETTNQLSAPLLKGGSRPALGRVLTRTQGRVAPMVHVELGMLRLAGSWETWDFGSAVQNLPQIVRLPSFPSPLGVRPELWLGSLPVPRPTPGLLSWASPPNEVLAGSTPSWHPIFRRPRPWCLKTSVNPINRQMAWVCGTETQMLDCVSASSPATAPGARLSPSHSRCPVSHLLSPFPPGCGSVLLVPAEGLHLLHAVRGCTHRGKCVMGTSPGSLASYLPIILLSLG